jgi:hypothetical protein
MRIALLMLALALPCARLFAQDNDPAVSISGGPPVRAWTSLLKYTTIGGADYVEYICYARTNQSAVTASVTQIVDAANTATVTVSSAHGLSVNNRVAISGVTGDTDLNGIYIVLTVPSATTFTYTSANVTDTTYNNAGITLISSAPRTNRNIWAIKKFTYGGTGGNNVLATQWAVKATNVISGTGSDNACDSRAALAYQ